MIPSTQTSNPAPIVHQHPTGPVGTGVAAATGKGCALDLTLPLPELQQTLAGDGVLRRSFH